MIVPVTDYTFPNLDPESKALAVVGASVKGFQSKTEAEVIANIAGSKVVIAQFAPITKKVLASLASGATVIRYGVGVDNIDLKAAKELAIKVAYVPDYCMDEVANHTVAMLLSLMRALPILDKGVRNNRWDGIAMAEPLVPLKEAKIGLIGLGRIGSEVVKRMKVFGSTINVYDPYLSQEKADEIGVNLVGLDELFTSSDAISLHSPLNDQTKYIINSKSLSKMKANAVIVNAARGGLINTKDLIVALKNKTICAAALDVFEQEPLADDSELKKLDNILLSPHLAWYSNSAIERLQRLAGEEAARAVAGESLRCPYPL